ncbi:uncharacterized protein LAESUDRAFT_815464 [Laetiporus sulphureus 93-53]|uniref:Protein kinase domain-containing protein n=1 Tax=Laetiporus sulphureus 93-53 TaxID=1314785 RepID=A0A165C628_9APHY|nr:uncharacterized protein LAESUDRAFT_815464 [Laetiporus sulphureus 93-53]KZT02266.1 hypothetical protein LAESUDRAFT_815464 [Laetiporus sulphureus 93-53]
MLRPSTGSAARPRVIAINVFQPSIYPRKAFPPLQFLRYRMQSTGSTSLIRPDHIFSNAPPPPWPRTTAVSPVMNENSTVFSQLKWKESRGDDKTLAGVLSHLQGTLRSVHNRKVMWPAEESIPSDPSPDKYLMMLLQPIADLFNQLRSPLVLKTPMECISVDFGDSIYGATFAAEDFSRWATSAPVILSLPDDLFNSRGEVSSRVQSALSKALESKSLIPSIIVTNFKDIAVFLPPTRTRPEHTFERVLTNQPHLALRVISTAYLLRALPSGLYIDMPHPDIEVDQNLILPEGPPKDPNQSLMSDEEVFATHHRHSDFDIETLVRDRARALQFFRWHEHVQRQCSKLVAHPNDILNAVTNEVGQIVPDVRPIYPFDFSEIPTDTITHLKSVQRDSPLVAAGIARSFEESKSFMLKIQDVVAEGSERGICTVYRCQITSIDSTPVSSPALCLKLFDDRFQPLQRPDEDDEQLDERLPRWFDSLVIAQTYALNEAFAYDKLRVVQGTVVPWFYGTHQFTLPDGTVLYGLLMEYIEGWALDSEFARKLSADRQIKMIQSCRHAARVLDLADISQRDWHNGQIILYTNPRTKVNHAVLIDFASTTQTWLHDELNYIDNYFGVLYVLLGRQGDVGLDPELVWKHYGEPDDWDPVEVWLPTDPPRNQEKRLVKARDMFPYISSA